jgi:hypothetical protein
MEFKVRDRVAVYGCGSGSSTFWFGQKGSIVEITEDSMLIVSPDDFRNERHCVHPKQCRKLKNKELKRIWLSPNWDDGKDFQQPAVATNPNRVDAQWIEFVEVKRK